MIISRLAYRASQFRRVLLPTVPFVETAHIRSYLSAAQLALFRLMQPSEQAHACSVFERLEAERWEHADLLAAALLHDIGKILCILSPLERAIVVIGQRLFPRLAPGWGEGMPRGWRRPFVVAAHHADWGADLAARAGASPCTVGLIRRHQDPFLKNPLSREDRLLAALQRADNSN